MASQWSVFKAEYEKYGWTSSGRFMFKSGFKSLKVLPDLTQFNGDIVVVMGTIEPFPLPPLGGQYVTIGSAKDIFEQTYTPEQIKGSTNNNQTPATDIITGALSTAQSAILNTINTTSSTLSSSLNTVSNNLENSILNARNTITGTINSTSNSVLNRVGDSTRTLTTAVTNATETIINRISSNANQVNQLQQAVVGTINNSSQNVINSISSDLRGVQSNLVTSLVNNSRDTQSFLDRSISNASNSLGSKISNVSNQIDQSTFTISNNINSSFSGIMNGITTALDPLNALASLIGGDYSNLFGNVIPTAIDDVGKSINRIVEALQKLMKGDYKKWSDFINDLGVFEGNSNIINTIINAFLVVPIASNVFSSAGQIYSQNIVKLLMAEVRPTSLLSPDILKALLRREISDDKANELLAKLGFSDDFINILKSNNRMLFDVNEIKNLYLRGMIDEENHDNQLRKLGFGSVQIQQLKKLYYPIPFAQDLIRFAVREVFSPETVETYGMDQDFPQDFLTYAKQVGLDERWAKAYWAAHWDLPSPTMGFEMFHRGIVSKDELRDLLKSLDVMPYWRDKLIQLSYNPITRVDVRRLYQMGVITLDDVEKRYLAIGYSPNDAKLLAKFTHLDTLGDDEQTATEIKTLSKSVIETGYKKGVISRDSAKSSLMDLGYSDDDSNIILAIADIAKADAQEKTVTETQTQKAHKYILEAYKRRSISYSDARESLLELDFISSDIDVELAFADYEYNLGVKTQIINKVQELYLSNVIDDVELKTMLTVNGFNIKEIEQILAELVIYRELRDRKPTKADFDKFYKSGVLTREEYIHELKGLGYADKYIVMYMLMLDPDEDGDE